MDPSTTGRHLYCDKNTLATLGLSALVIPETFLVDENNVPLDLDTYLHTSDGQIIYRSSIHLYIYLSMYGYIM